MDQLFYSFQTAWDWVMTWWNGFSGGAKDNIIGTLVGGLLLGSLVVFRNVLFMGIRRLFRKPPLPPPPPLPVEPQKFVIELKPPPTPVVEPPPARPASPVPVRLPSTSVDFVPRRDKDGRDLLAVLQEELSPQRNQVVTLWGPGGVGKTSLAAKAFRILTPQFPQRVWTSADGRPDFSLSTLLDAIASQLGNEDVRRLNEQAKAEEVQRLLATTPTLVVPRQFRDALPCRENSLCRVADTVCSMPSINYLAESSGTSAVAEH